MGWKWVGRIATVVLCAAVLVSVVAVGFTPIGERIAGWASGSDWTVLKPAERVTALSQLRQVAVQVAAAVGAAAALVFTGRTYHLARRGQVTDRFTKALERLSSDKSYARIGGVLSLERIVKDSPDQAVAAARVLNAFLSACAPVTKFSGLEKAGLPSAPNSEASEALRVLVQALPVIASSELPRVDLSGRHFAGARLAQADLRGANLTKASFAGADFSGARVAGADFTGADLTGSDFTAARGLRATQLKSAVSLEGCVLPQSLAIDDELVQRVRSKQTT